MSSLVTIVPVKDTRRSKQRTSARLNSDQRQRLALTMLEDVLEALRPTSTRSPIVLVTIDPAAIALAQKYGASTTATGAHDGHTGAVRAAADELGAQGATGYLTVPGDIPLITADEVRRILDAHDRGGPAFTIAPSHDEMGSNAIACSPVDAVPLRFGDDSYRPHLAAARAHGIAPTILELPGIAQDIDAPADLDRFMTRPGAARTRTFRFLEQLQTAATAPAESQA